MKHFPSLQFAVVTACLLGLCSSSAQTAEPDEENPIIDLSVPAAEGLNVRVTTSKDLPLYVGRRAGRVLDVLAAKQTVTILAIDRFGLRVKGRGKNGQLTGWLGQKKLFEGDARQLAKISAFYERQLKLRKFVVEKSPAIGMSLAELKRTLGRPSNHMLNSSGEEKTEYVVWIIKEEVDLNDALDLGTDADIFKTEVETGRIEIELVDGLAKSINMNVADGANIPTIAPPVVAPFGAAPGKLAGK